MKLTREHWIRAAFLFLCCAVLIVSTLLLLGKKEAFYTDEYISYSCSNHEGGREMPLELGRAYTPEEIRRLADETYTVSPDARFRYDRVWQNLSVNVHPPLFYAALHTVCSLTPGVFSVYQAGAVNLFFALVSLFFFYKLTRALARSEWLAGFLLLAWTCTLGLYETVTYLRDYTPAMCGVVMVTWECLRFLRGSRKLRDLVKIAAASAFTALCHYYGIIWLFFLCAALCVILLLRRDWKNALRAAGAEAVAGAAVVALFPAILKSLFSSTRGTEAASNLKSLDLGDFFSRMGIFGGDISTEFFGSLLPVLLALVLLLVLVFLVVKAKKRLPAAPEAEGETALSFADVCLLAAPAAGYFVLVSKIAAYTKLRYMLPVVPVLYLALVAALLFFGRPLLRRRVLAVVLALVMAVLSGLSWTTGQIRYLYVGQTDRVREMLEPYRGTDAVMFWGSGLNAMCIVLPQCPYYGSVTFCYAPKEDDLAGCAPLSEGKNAVIIMDKKRISNGFLDQLKAYYPDYTVREIGPVDAQHKFINYYFFRESPET